jgi:phosphohistidine swiveling domain-containing protein
LVGIARTFVERTYAEVEAVNIAAQICLDEARRRLAAAKLDPAPHLAPPETALARLLAEAARLSGEERRSLLRGSFGHRAVFDYELSCPRYEEDLASLDALVRANASWAAGPRKPVALPEGAGRTLARTVAQARRLQALKEDAKHVAMREIAVLRRAILALDERLGSQGLAFFLTLEELAGAAEGGGLEALVALAEAREARNRLMAEVPPLPPRLTATALETLSLSSPRPAATAGGLVRGVRVSGSGDVQGRARVVGRREAENGLPIAGFQDGDIIVSPMLHPSWLPYLPRAGGLVCEVGGWLSHMAILAREYHVTLIVEAAPLDGIPDGALVRLNEDGSVDPLPVLTEAIPVLAAE